MKKIFIAFFSITIITLMLFLLSGCNVKSNNYEKFISDVRYGIFDGQCNSYNATFTYGLREKPYSPNGVANNKVEFGIISVIFTEKVEEDEIVCFSLKINEDIISGTLEKSPYTDQYMADIGKICSDTDRLSLDVYFASDTSSTIVDLTNKSANWEVNYEDALSNGLSSLSGEIKEFVNKDSSYEIQVKILNDQQTNFGSYFWSVTIISSSGAKHNVVFSTSSKDILVKN